MISDAWVAEYLDSVDPDVHPPKRYDVRIRDHERKNPGGKGIENRERKYTADARYYSRKVG
jgi:hypothetical protein